MLTLDSLRACGRFALLALSALPVLASGPFIPEGPARVGYWTTGDGVAVTGTSGECWHTRWWTPEMAVAGCDAVAEPAPSAEPGSAPEPAAPQTAVPAAMTLSDSLFFAFDRANLDRAARQTITTLLERVPKDREVTQILLTGYADRIGAEAYNQVLSQKRADAVAAVLAQEHGFDRAIIRAGAQGETRPSTACGESLRWKALLECLQPDRRVDLELVIGR